MLLTSLDGVKVGDVVFTQNILDSNNSTGLDNKGYNGYFTVTGVPNSMEYEFSNTDNNGVKRNTGNFFNNTFYQIFNFSL